MERQSLVLIISCRQAMQHLAEWACRWAGVQTVTVASVHEAAAIALERGLHDFALVIVDTADSGQNPFSQPRMACQLLREWTAASPRLSFVFVGTVTHKRVLLKIRADIVRFVTEPFGLHVFIEAIESCLLSTAPRARHLSASLSEKAISVRARHVPDLLHMS